MRGARRNGPAFRKYGSFEPPTARDLEQLEASGSATRDRWVASEKVHGANLCLATDGSSVSSSSRTGMLRGAESHRFFDSQKIVDKYSPHVLKAFESVRRRMGTQVDALYVYGELFGGAYPHRDVQEVPGAVCVQKHVYYCPHNDFYAFDLSTGKGFLDFDLCLEVFREAGLFCAEPLLTGTLQECLAYPNSFPTTIPGRLGLPAIPDNIAEGVVIKRVRGSRPIFKSKNERFVEVTGGACRAQVLESSAQNDEGEPQAAKVQRQQTERTALPTGAELLELARSYVNSNRLDSVLSKVGQVGPEDRRRLVSLLVKDAMADFLKSLVGRGLPPREALKEVNVVCEGAAREVVDAFMSTK